MRDMRDVEPGGMEPGARNLLDARERHSLDWTEFGEVDLRHRRQPAARRRRGRALGERRFQVVAGDAALFARPLDEIQIEAELAREPSNGWPGENAGEIGERWPGGSLGRPGRQIAWRNGRGFGGFGGVLFFLRVRLVLLISGDLPRLPAGIELRNQRAHRHLVADLDDNFRDL